MSSEFAAPQAALDSTATQIAAQTAQLADIKLRLLKLEAAQPGPAPAPSPSPQLLWHAGMEVGNLSEWSEEVATGNAKSSTVQAVSEGIPARTPWVMKQAWLGPSGTAEASGTRMSRYPEINSLCKAGTPFYYSWWDYFTAPPSLGAVGWYNHWQIMSNDPAGKNAPIWIMGLDSSMKLSFTWSPNNLAPAEGPHAGEGGTRTYTQAGVVPVGQWVFFEVGITPRGDFAGSLSLWVNKQLALSLTSIKTQFPFAAQSLFTYIANNCYGALTAPFAHYVDDVTVSLGRVS